MPESPAPARIVCARYLAPVAVPLTPSAAVSAVGKSSAPGHADHPLPRDIHCGLRPPQIICRKVTRPRRSPAQMSTTRSCVHFLQYSDTLAAVVSGYSRMIFPDLHTGHGINTPSGVALQITTAFLFMKPLLFWPGLLVRVHPREIASRAFMVDRRRASFKYLRVVSLPLFLKLYLIIVTDFQIVTP